MPARTDGRGRIYLPAEIREKFGDEYRIVELPDRVALLPVDEDPIEGVQEAVGDALDGTDRDRLTAEAISKAKADVASEADGRKTDDDGE